MPEGLFIAFDGNCHAHPELQTALEPNFNAHSNMYDEYAWNEAQRKAIDIETEEKVTSPQRVPSGLSGVSHCSVNVDAAHSSRGVLDRAKQGAMAPAISTSAGIDHATGPAPCAPAAEATAARPGSAKSAHPPSVNAAS